MTVPTLDETVTLRIPPGTSSGQTFRVKGRGVPAHGKTAAGDLLVTVEVAVPKKLTDEQRAAVEELGPEASSAATDVRAPPGSGT